MKQFFNIKLIMSKPNENQIQNGNEFNVELNGKNSQQKIIFDLNKIFHLDLSYNFDLLKNLLSEIIKNQKEKDNKIEDLENQLLNFKITFNESMGNPEIVKKLKENTPKMSLLLKGKEFPNTSVLNKKIRPPPNNVVLEQNPKYDPIINQIIVRNINII